MPKSDLYFEKPVMNAAGTLGFSPDIKSGVDFSQLGAFITNPVSLAPRTPAKGTRYLPFSGGFLLHTGYPNPGLSRVIRNHARKWDRSPMPIIVNLLAQDPNSVWEMTQRLEGIESISGVEIGLPPDIDPGSAVKMAEAAVGELAVIVRVPLERSFELGLALKDTGLSAISLSPPRGAYPDKNGNLTTGRIYGPSVFPMALAQVTRLILLDIPIIASGGIYKSTDIEAMLTAGAIAVQIDSLLWRPGIFPEFGGKSNAY
jgi:dihydroorotate dehydrogenase (NAD+) catalytic subunit